MTDAQRELLRAIDEDTRQLCLKIEEAIVGLVPSVEAAAGSGDAQTVAAESFLLGAITAGRVTLEAVIREAIRLELAE